MSRTFNCGIGGVLVVRSEESKSVLNSLTNSGVQASVIGEIYKKEGNIIYIHSKTLFMTETVVYYSKVSMPPEDRLTLSYKYSCHNGCYSRLF